MDDQEQGENGDKQPQVTANEKETPSSDAECKSKPAKTRKPYTITKARERWTDEEHTRFLEGMSLYGRSWGKVASHVHSKTTIQIRSHAQKYFNRIKKQQDSGSAAPGQLMHPIDHSRPVVQSWQSPSQQMLPAAEHGSAPVASEPFQRAAEIVAAAATEAAAAAASVVVSAASKKIKEQLEGLYSQPGVRGGVAATKALSSCGPGAAEAQPDGVPPVRADNGQPARLSAFAPTAQEAATSSPLAVPPIVPQAVLAGNMQSIETAIALKAMQRIAALFQHSPDPSDAGTASQLGHTAAVPVSAFAVMPSGGSSAFVPLPASSPHAPSEPTLSEPNGQQAKPCTGVVNAPSDGAFCGDSDVVGDVKEVTSGGGTGASQAFSEVGIDTRHDLATPPQHGTAKPMGDDSGSSHASEPPVRISHAHQEYPDTHTVAQDAVQPLNVNAMMPWHQAALAGITQAAARGVMLPTYAVAKVMHLPSDSKSVLTPDGSPGPAQPVVSVKTSGSLATQTMECLSKPPASAGHHSVNHPHSNATASNGGPSNGVPSNGFISSAHGSYSTTPGTNGMPSNGTALHSGNGSNGQSVQNSSTTYGHTLLAHGTSVAATTTVTVPQQAAPTADYGRLAWMPWNQASTRTRFRWMTMMKNLRWKLRLMMRRQARTSHARRSL
eukprot:jgi/Ulvmu1/5110/UM021_0127.1